MQPLALRIRKITVIDSGGAGTWTLDLVARGRKADAVCGGQYLHLGSSLSRMRNPF